MDQNWPVDRWLKFIFHIDESQSEASNYCTSFHDIVKSLGFVISSIEGSCWWSEEVCLGLLVLHIQKAGRSSAEGRCHGNRWKTAMDDHEWRRPLPVGWFVLWKLFHDQISYRTASRWEFPQTQSKVATVLNQDYSIALKYTTQCFNTASHSHSNVCNQGWRLTLLCCICQINSDSVWVEED
jgi:hypothetical protein